MENNLNNIEMYGRELRIFTSEMTLFTKTVMAKIGQNVDKFWKKIQKLETEEHMHVPHYSSPGLSSFTVQKNVKSVAENKNSISMNITLFLL